MENNKIFNKILLSLTKNSTNDTLSENKSLQDKAIIETFVSKIEEVFSQLEFLNNEYLKNYKKIIQQYYDEVESVDSIDTNMKQSISSLYEILELIEEFNNQEGGTYTNSD